MTYYLRSSVLGGAAVADLSPDGAGGLSKLRSYFYAGGARVAKYDVGAMHYDHAAPATNSSLETRAGDRYAGRKERDPAGGELPLYDPNPGQSYVDQKWQQPMMIEGGDPYDYSGGYSIDGLPVSASEFERRVGGGGGAVGVEVTIGGHSLGVFGIPYRGMGYIPHQIGVSSITKTRTPIRVGK